MTRERLIEWSINVFVVLTALSIPALIAADIYWDYKGSLAVWVVLPFILFMAGG